MRVSLAVIPLLLAASIVPAHADTFTAVISDSGLGLTLTLDITANATSNPNVFAITAITGDETATGGTPNPILYEIGSATSATSPGTATSPNGGTALKYDNLLYTSGPLFDQYGVLYAFDGTNSGFPDPSYRELLYSTGLGEYVFNRDDGLSQETLDNSSLTTTTLTNTSTPEPSSFILLGTGVLAMAGALRRRLAQK